MSLELEKKFPGVSWGFSQPIEDNMEEAVSGVKGELATKIYGDAGASEQRAAAPCNGGGAERDRT